MVRWDLSRAYHSAGRRGSHGGRPCRRHCEVDGNLRSDLHRATQTKINTANFYLASTNFQSFFSRAFNVTLPRFVWVLFVGVVSFTVMVLDVFSFIGTWLSYQGAVLVAWVGIALVHIGYHRLSKSRNAFEFRPGRVRN